MLRVGRILICVNTTNKDNLLLLLLLLLNPSLLLLLLPIFHLTSEHLRLQVNSTSSPPSFVFTPRIKTASSSSSSSLAISLALSFTFTLVFALALLCPSFCIRRLCCLLLVVVLLCRCTPSTCPLVLDACRK